MMRRAKIVATIGPATDSVEKLLQLIEAGMDVARINMSHGKREHHGTVIDRIRSISSRLARPIAIMLDLSGPKIRTGRLRGGEAVIEESATVRITSDDVEGDSTRFSASYPHIAREVQPGDRILISDGEIELEVIDTSEKEVVARVIHGGVLGEHKGINLPGARLSIPSITPKDLEDLRFGIERGVDIVAQSFVRGAADCLKARELITSMGGEARLIAKIEKPEAVDDLDGILEAADGVMVARGDLAVETSTELVPILQKRIIARALFSEKTIITATQMLQSMIENPRPTRAEASDVANAIIDGSDALMLSGETAIGKFPIESVMMMDRIIRSTEEMGDAPFDSVRRSLQARQSGSHGRAVAEAAMCAAEEINCRLIVVISRSGHMARRIKALRPRQRIIALTSRAITHRQLAVSWGVEPYVIDDELAPGDSLLACADRTLVQHNLAATGESVVIMAGRLDDIILSLSMKLHRVGDLS